MANEEKFAPIEGKYLTYLDQPLVREGQTICYGDKSEKCFLILEIMSYKKEHGRDIPDNILIQVVDSKDPGKIIKQGDKSGLHNALTMGMVWLERANRS
ncbi:MAG: hypothetical protein J6S71_00715 [Clostridia bacterium]|jgi:hypothetical protein|nr:hypothetical protein [Clostridia bacterium]